MRRIWRDDTTNIKGFADKKSLHSPPHEDDIILVMSVPRNVECLKTIENAFGALPNLGLASEDVVGFILPNAHRSLLSGKGLASSQAPGALCTIDALLAQGLRQALAPHRYPERACPRASQRRTASASHHLQLAPKHHLAVCTSAYLSVNGDDSEHQAQHRAAKTSALCRASSAPRERLPSLSEAPRRWPIHLQSAAGEERTCQVLRKKPSCRHFCCGAFSPEAACARIGPSNG